MNRTFNTDMFINELNTDLDELKEQRAANYYVNQVMNMHNNLIEEMKIDQKYSNFEKACQIYNMSADKQVSSETKKKVLNYIQNNGITDMNYTMKLLYRVENGKVAEIGYNLRKY